MCNRRAAEGLFKPKTRQLFCVSNELMLFCMQKMRILKTILIFAVLYLVFGFTYLYILDIYISVNAGASRYCINFFECIEKFIDGYDGDVPLLTWPFVFFFLASGFMYRFTFSSDTVIFSLPLISLPFLGWLSYYIVKKLEKPRVNHK